MPSGLNWLPVITKPPPGRWEQEPWIGIRDTSSMILQVLCLSLAAGGLLVSCHSSILLSRSPLPLPSPHGHLHSHYMSNSLFPEYISLPYVPLSSPSIKPSPTHLSNPKSFLFFQEAFPDCSNHLLFYSPAEQSTQLSHIT